MDRRIGTLFTVVTLAPMLGAAGPGVPVPVEWTQVDLPSAGIALKLGLPGSYAHWVVGVKVVPGCREHAQIADGYFPFARRFEGGHSGHPGGAPSARVVAHGASLLAVSSSGVQVSPPASLEGGPVLIVYLEIATRRRLEVFVDGASRFSGGVDGTAVIEDGVVRSTQLFGAGDLVVQASSAGVPQYSDRSFKPGGFLSPATASSLLTKYVEFAKTSSRPASLTFMAKLAVAADGTVQSVGCNEARVSSDLCGVITAAMSEWRFRPWELNGAASPFWTWVPVTVGPDGTVSSAMSPGGSWQ